MSRTPPISRMFCFFRIMFRYEMYRTANLPKRKAPASGGVFGTNLHCGGSRTGFCELQEFPRAIYERYSGGDEEYLFYSLSDSIRDDYHFPAFVEKFP